MSDLRLVANNRNLAVTMDLLQLPAGQLDETEELATLAMVALGTDRRANDDDELPGLDEDGDRRGWWGDTNAASIWDAWPIGSRLWLLERAKITGTGARQGSTLARVEAYVREALQPLVTKRIASRVTVSATRSGDERIDAVATIYRGPKKEIQLLFQGLWTGVRT